MPSPKEPSKYVGPNVYTLVGVIRNRRPLLSDYRQPETGRNYEIATIWAVGANPTTGIFGELWALQKIVSNQGYWTMVSSGSGPGPVQSLLVQTATSPGMTTVNENGSGQISISGAVVAAHSVPLETRSRALYAFNLEAQIASLVAATPANSNSVGLACFNSADFTLDATSGMVSIIGGPAGQVNSLTGDDATAVTPTAANINILGNVVANATHAKPVFVENSATSTERIDVQIAVAVAATPANTNSAGLACFNNTEFTVDSTSAMVSLKVNPTNGFMALLSTNTGGITGNGGFPTIIFDNNSTGGAFDPNGLYNTSTGVFTANVTGKWLIGMQLSWGMLTSSMTSYKARIQTLGTDEFRTTELNIGAAMVVGNATFSSGNSVVISLTSGTTTTIKAIITGGSGDTAILQGGSGLTNFWAYQLGT